MPIERHDAKAEVSPDQLVKGHWEFLTRVVPGNPWIAGLAAIIGIVWLGSTPWVQAFAIIGITVITVFSTWTWRLGRAPGRIDAIGDVRDKANSVHSPHQAS